MKRKIILILCAFFVMAFVQDNRRGSSKFFARSGTTLSLKAGDIFRIQNTAGTSWLDIKLDGSNQVVFNRDNVGTDNFVFQVNGAQKMELHETNGLDMSVPTRIRDDKPYKFGTGNDFAFEYRSGSTLMELRRGNVSGASQVFDVTDGSSDIRFYGILERSVTATITAGATQTQAGATALITEINQVSVCATANDGVALPPAKAGYVIIVINNGAQNLQIWPAAGESDAIDGGAADAVDANVLAAGATRTYVSYDGTNWETL